MGGELSADMAHLLRHTASPAGRYNLSLSAAHDFGVSGGLSSSPVTLAHADAVLGLVFREGFEFFAVAGAGTGVAAVGISTSDGEAGHKESESAASGLAAPEATTATTGTRLQRPTLRESTKRAIERAAPKTADGKFIDANTGEIIDGPYHYPEWFQIERPGNNLSHKFEKPGGE
jgi:hypothetical protein